MKYVYLVVEGPHDVAAIGRILRINGLNLVNHIGNVNSYWDRIIPRTFPPKGDLLARVPVPTFYQTEGISVAIQTAGGDSGLVGTLSASLNNIKLQELTSIALFCDADTKVAKEKIIVLLDNLHKKLNVPGITFASRPGEISNGYPRTGIFIFPDNINEGNLENVLLECAATCYPDLLDSATTYVKSVDHRYSAENWTNSSEPKAIVGCITNVLKPGKANQVSIQDNDWICRATIDQVTGVSKLSQFLTELIF
jgi:hypothetical protein